MTRRPFALYSLGLLFIAFVGLFAGVGLLRFVAAAASLEPGDRAFDVLMIGGSVLFGGLALWAVIAMAVKRCRDSGLSARLFATGLPGLPFLDHMILAPRVPEPMAWPLDSFTPVALVGLVALYLFLLLAPSQPIAPLTPMVEAETAVPPTDEAFA